MDSGWRMRIVDVECSEASGLIGLTVLGGIALASPRQASANGRSAGGGESGEPLSKCWQWPKIRLRTGTKTAAETAVVASGWRQLPKQSADKITLYHAAHYADGSLISPG